MMQQAIIGNSILTVFACMLCVCMFRLETLEVLLPEAYGEWQRSECTETREEVISFQETIKKQLKKVFVW